MCVKFYYYYYLYRTEFQTPNSVLGPTVHCQTVYTPNRDAPRAAAGGKCNRRTWNGCTLFRHHEAQRRCIPLGDQIETGAYGPRGDVVAGGRSITQAGGRGGARQRGNPSETSALGRGARLDARAGLGCKPADVRSPLRPGRVA
jgi:hypothetical protein